MGIHLCYKWDKPNEMVQVVSVGLQSNVSHVKLSSQLKSWMNSIHLFKSV